MKNLFTLFLISITTLGFGQSTTAFPGAPKKFTIIGNSARPGSLDKQVSTPRGSGGCDTVDIIDYNTYNEVIANTIGITYNGSWNSSTPQPYAEEINSSFITVNNADNGVYSYVVQTFDSLAFSNYANSSVYSKQLAATTITLDTLYMFMGISADDTSALGGLSGDSLKLTIYPISAGTVSSTASQTITYSGYTGLAPFVVGETPGYLRLATVPVGQTFAAGQGFAVEYQFFSSDTSSHCYLSFSYADSCGTITYEGQQYSSPAYPSPFVSTAKYAGNVGSAFWGEIDSSGPTTATVRPISNAFAYQLSGVAANCSYVYSQNWEILAEVSVQSSLGLSIADSVYTIPCNGNISNPQTLLPSATGDLAGATYAWSSNVSGSQSTTNSSFYNPGTYSVTVTNLQGCTATAQETATFANGLSIPPPTFSYPNEICEKASVSFSNTTSNLSGYHWTFGTSSIPASGSVNPTVTYDTTGNYTVVLTLDTEGCILGTSETITVENCAGIQNVPAFENSINVMPNPSNGNVNITVSDADKNITITVYNVLGQTVKSYATTESPAVFNKNLDLSALSNGTYLIKIQSGNKVATKKLVITK